MTETDINYSESFIYGMKEKRYHKYKRYKEKYTLKYVFQRMIWIFTQNPIFPYHGIIIMCSEM